MNIFNEASVLHEIEHYLPAQAPLKDFIHHNTLHAFQAYRFDEALSLSRNLFGYKTSFSLNEFRSLYEKGIIKKDILLMVLKESEADTETEELVFTGNSDKANLHSVGSLRKNWKKYYKTDLDSFVHPLLFRIVCSYLDQGISIWKFPYSGKGFLDSLRDIERNSKVSFFKTKHVRKLFLDDTISFQTLLSIIVGDKSLFRQYLYDQQFAHPGWSGMVATVAAHPETLLDERKISLKELITFELFLEKDALDFHLKAGWIPLSEVVHEDDFIPLPTEPSNSVYDKALSIWQKAYEWSYYNDVIAAVKTQTPSDVDLQPKFQAMFCIDDRSFSIRHYLEKFEPACETYGTAGFFNAGFYFKPLNGKFSTKLAPAPMKPKWLIKETGSSSKHRHDMEFTRETHFLFRGWIISQLIGFWAAIKLLLNIFLPSAKPSSASSLKHMNHQCDLTVENISDQQEDGLQVGYNVDEMVETVSNLLKGIGLVKNFSKLIYIVGHGSSSVNNPHYAAYDCGACSGRPGSVNARVVSTMANDHRVRIKLAQNGIAIPDDTQFIGALHDTSRDEMVFFDTHILSDENKWLHKENISTFDKALDYNAKERSRRFELTDTRHKASHVHHEVLKRSVSLFETRPELNHATNALCIIGGRCLTKDLFLDRRAFLNSYDYRIDKDGSILLNILKAAAPVCGGINLEYFFSKTDNQKLGAGSKLPHNVMGLIGVANGIDGDLRPGLPAQMIEVHDPVRLLMIVEQYPDKVLDVIKQSSETYEWFKNEWIHLAVLHPDQRIIYRYINGHFLKYAGEDVSIPIVSDIEKFVESSSENLPVSILR